MCQIVLGAFIILDNFECLILIMDNIKQIQHQSEQEKQRNDVMDFAGVFWSKFISFYSLMSVSVVNSSMCPSYINQLIGFYMKGAWLTKLL